MKKLSIFDLFAKPLQPARPFRLQPPRAVGRYMRAKQFAEGVVHYSSFRAAYLEKTPTRTRRLPLAGKDGLPLLDEKGRIVFGNFPVPEPWRRVTPKTYEAAGVKNCSRGFARRAALREQRANA